MAATFAFYSDASLLTKVTRISLPRPPMRVSRLAWLGTRTASRRLVPREGQTAIQVGLAGELAPQVRLSRTLSGLASATPGAALALTATITANTPIYISIDPGTPADHTLTANLTLAAMEETWQLVST
jgi:hypothetical protein